jgi:hypothetical protein
MPETPTPEALAWAVDGDAHLLATAIIALVREAGDGYCRSEVKDRINAWYRQMDRATWAAAATILREEDFTNCPGAVRALDRFRARAAAQGGRVPPPAPVVGRFSGCGDRIAP